MLSQIQNALDAVLGPIVRRPKSLQMAALCHRRSGGRKEYLLITSRDTGRWVIPKGWPIRGLNAAQTALREAWEEAGVKNSTSTDAPIGTYRYLKRLANGKAVQVKTLVYSVAVKDLSEEFPEAHERTRKWVSAEEGARLVQEAELKSIFRAQRNNDFLA